MPLQSSHVFASHIGHTGKTSLCYQISCYYAKRHPEIKVMVMDNAEEGDLTKRLLGGVDSSKEKLKELGGIFRLLDDADRKTSGMTSWFWRSDVDVTAFAIKVADHNKHVPPNLFLISSGAWPRDEPPMTDETRQRVSAAILNSFAKSSDTWKLFCDTDGDRRPSPMTMLGYSLCKEAIVPLHLNKGDLDRTETMLGVMAELREQGQITTQVLFIVWNMVNSIKDQEYTHNGITLPFTPTKVNLDILDACNARLFGFSNELPGLFVHHGSDEVTFRQSATCVLRQLADNVLKPSEELGLPFVSMVDQIAESGKKTMKFKSGPAGIEYTTDDRGIQNVATAVSYLEQKMEAMSLGS